MDDIVRQALAKWPSVPHCWGWLALDARGQWWLRDERAQAAGPFTGGDPAARGDLLRHDKLVEFIGRNYECDAAGAWFFQNGPQRVYVELEATPWIWRVGDDLSVSSHTGRAAHVAQCFTDEAGRVYLATDLGPGLVHSLDVALAAEAIEAGRWPLGDTLAQADIAAHFGFVRQPQPLSK